MPYDSKEKIAIQSRKYREENKEKIREYKKNWLEKKRIGADTKRKEKRTKEERLLAVRKYANENKEKIILKGRAYDQYGRLNLTDAYIRKLLVKGLKISSSVVSKELIELKRIVIKTEKLCLQLKNS